ncbi:MAG: hypothetical protein AAGF60_16070 [Pseudomonadota bacterium]
MLRNTTFGAGLALSVAAIATPASADEHEVTLLGIGIFPNVIYVDVDDTLKFINDSDTVLYVTSHQDKWAVGPIEPGASATMQTKQHMKLPFITTTDPNASFADYNGQNAEGEDEPIAPMATLNFSPPPLGKG